MKPLARRYAIFSSLLICLPLTGCGNNDLDDLHAYVKEVKARPAGKIDPLPEIRPQETFAYTAAKLRDPFSPPVKEAPPTVVNQLKPDINRQKEVLEDYPLDALKMVGTVENDSETWSLVRAPGGIIHRVKPNNYLGQNYGRVINISEEGIELVETIEDGQGGWLERPASLVLSENK